LDLRRAVAGDPVLKDSVSSLSFRTAGSRTSG